MLRDPGRGNKQEEMCAQWDAASGRWGGKSSGGETASGAIGPMDHARLDTGGQR